MYTDLLLLRLLFVCFFSQCKNRFKHMFLSVSIVNHKNNCCGILITLTFWHTYDVIQSSCLNLDTSSVRPPLFVCLHSYNSTVTNRSRHGSHSWPTYKPRPQRFLTTSTSLSVCECVFRGVCVCRAQLPEILLKIVIASLNRKEEPSVCWHGIERRRKVRICLCVDATDVWQTREPCERLHRAVFVQVSNEAGLQ